jgi:tRNA-specific 2-thiouridylase
MMERVVVGMSGGVDSSMAAALLREQGFEVIGATMLVWSPPGVDMGHSDSCCGLSAAEDARRVCAALGIPHYTLDFKDVFYETIIRDYAAEYARGRTPNPCVRCNEYVKWGALLRRAEALGASHVATGHYARIRRDPGDRPRLLRAADTRKDQSYALYRLSPEHLARTLFPLGELTKAEVRRRAAELGLPTAGKPDSQETCFVPNNDYPTLLRILVPETFRPGEIRGPEGQVLGRHGGVAEFTIGQRKRINVGSPVPLYVSNIAAEEGAVTVVPAEHPSLFSRTVRAGQGVAPGLPADGEAGGDPMRVQARIRYNAAGQPGNLWLSREGDDLRLEVEFDEPVRAVTPGQHLVCYRGDEVVAGGVID